MVWARAKELTAPSHCMAPPQIVELGFRLPELIRNPRASLESVLRVPRQKHLVVEGSENKRCIAEVLH